MNVPFLRYIADFGKPMFLSTGGTLEDIDRAVEAILPLNAELCVLHCTASYPADIEDLNLQDTSTPRALPEPGWLVSDPTSTTASRWPLWPTCSAPARSALHAESRMEGDRPRVLADARRDAPVRADLQRADRARRRRQATAPERGAVAKMGKKLVAARDLPAGHRLAPGDVVAKSPADGGVAPYELTDCSVDRCFGRWRSSKTSRSTTSSWPRARRSRFSRSVTDPLFDLSGRVAVVTGGMGQLGAVYAGGLAERGMRVAVWT